MSRATRPAVTIATATADLDRLPLGEVHGASDELSAS
jgi:hypothetical protein